MAKVTFIGPSGERQTVDIAAGQTVMYGARRAGIDGIPAECGGACSCSTCHVYVDAAWVGRLPPMQAMEADMIEFAPHVDPVLSRLSCQIKVSDALDGLVVAVPQEQA